MEYTKEQKEALRLKIEKEGNDYYHDQELAKEELNILAKETEELFGLKAATFKKLVKFHYKASIEEEKAKSDELYDTYKDIME